MTQARDLADLISNSQVDADEMGGASVDTASIVDGAVTDAKVASGIVGTKISYDNTVSGISANTMQEAVDYLNALSGGSSGSVASYTRDKFVATAGQTTFTPSNGYQVGYIEVYMNGVLLDISDYSASDGTNVVLSVGASAGDEIVTIALDSFAIAELLRIFNTSASAPDDAVTVDASGNVLLGTSDTDPSNDTTGTGGIALGAASYISLGRANATPLLVNRIGNDGENILIKKDGATAGRIGTYGGDMYVGNGNAGMLFYDALNLVLPADASTGVPSNGAASLGNGNYRWKDLYLSGGVYLGGTGSANYLDDYEEGTWTPHYGTTASPVSYTYGVQSGDYVKIGSMVYARFFIRVASVASQGSGILKIDNLPFSVKNVSYNGWMGSIGWNNQLTGWTDNPFNLAPIRGTDDAYVHGLNMSTGAITDLQSSALTANSVIEGTLIYETA